MKRETFFNPVRVQVRGIELPGGFRNFLESGFSCNFAKICEFTNFLGADSEDGLATAQGHLAVIQEKGKRERRFALIARPAAWASLLSTSKITGEKRAISNKSEEKK